MGVLTMARYLEVPQCHPPRTESSPTPSLRSTASNSSGKVLSLQELKLEDEFDVGKTLAEGCFSKTLLVRPKTCLRERLVLKAIHCEFTSAEEFSRELNYSYFLSPHPNIISSYNVAFMNDNCFVFAMEYAPYGDLCGFVKRDGLAEGSVKTVASQLVSAVEFIHSFHLVHRDIRMENVLVFRKDLSLVKLGDFGHTLPSGTSVVKTKTEFTACTCMGSSCPPEVAEIVLQERYYTHPAEDVWSLTMMLINCLCGDLPWSSADITDSSYCQWTDWLKRRSLKLPELFNSFSPRFLRLLKRVLEPKPTKRSKISEVSKYLSDEWLTKGATARRSSSCAGLGINRNESNASSRSGHTHRQKYGVSGKKRSTRSLKLDSELETEVEPVNERVGKWVIQTTVTINPTTTTNSGSS